MKPQTKHIILFGFFQGLLYALIMLAVYRLFLQKPYSFGLFLFNMIFFGLGMGLIRYWQLRKAGDKEKG